MSTVRLLISQTSTLKTMLLFILRIYFSNRFKCFETTRFGQMKLLPFSSENYPNTTYPIYKEVGLM